MDWLNFCRCELSRSAAFLRPPVWLKARVGFDARLLVEHVDDALHNFHRRGRQRGQALHDLVAQFAAQEHQQLRAFFGRKIAHNQGDGLRLFLLEQVEKLARRPCR